MIYSIDVEVTTPIRATEVTDRVEEAVTTLFPDAEVTTAHGELRAETHSVEHLRDRLFEQAILDTARGVFLEGVEGKTIAFALKKQAATRDVVNFVVGEPPEMGELQVRIRVREPDVESFVEYLAPPTRDGKPLTDE